MTYTGLENLTNTDLVDLLKFPSIDTSIFYPLIMFGLFIIFSMASYFSEKERTGKGNILSSSAVSGLVMIVLATILRLLLLISKEILIITIVLGSIFVGIYLLTRRR